MKAKINIRREVKLTLAVATLLVLIAFAEREQHDTTVKEIAIYIDNLNDNHFIDEEDVRRLMQFRNENLIGASVSSINLKEVERKIKADRFIEDAELYGDLKGNLLVNVTVRRPVARIVRNDGPDGYIAEDGTIMPVSEKFTSRVVLISGAYARILLSQENLFSTGEGRQLMDMLEVIREDEFWNAQVAQLDIDAKGKIDLLMQVGAEKIEFGAPEKIEEKFEKLMIYYKDILPAKGWGRYKRVNLEYEGQIIAE
jgi:cell division protein FtsQ